jgi:dephospho-CoA kinase
MMLKIGITGGIGSGKSLICRIFLTLGIPVYDADTRAKLILAENQIVRDSIKSAFGKESYFPDGSLNRPYLASQVFNDSGKVQILNDIVHPQVGKDFADWVHQQQGKAPYIIKEAALMFEAGSNKALDSVINVSAPVDIRVKRVLERDKRTESEIRAIISKQLSEEERKNLADYEIVNDGMIAVIPQVWAFHQNLLKGIKN